jgi:N-acetylneuraminate synthase/sialic acid synthase
MMQPKPKDELGQESVFKKLGKSVVALHDIEHGGFITLDDLSGKIFQEQYIPVRRSNELIGKRAVRKIFAGEIIEPGMFE